MTTSGDHYQTTKLGTYAIRTQLREALYAFSTLFLDVMEIVQKRTVCQDVRMAYVTSNRFFLRLNAWSIVAL